MDVSDSDEEEAREKDKGKEKIGEQKEKERTREKRKAPQEEQSQHKCMKTKSKAHKLPSDVQLGINDYDNIATKVQESLELPMTTLVSSQTELKSTLDAQIT